MIDPHTLATLTNLNVVGLSAALANTGYEGNDICNATFIGIANTGSFVYEVEYKDEHTGEMDMGHIYVTYDHERGAVTADY